MSQLTWPQLLIKLKDAGKMGADKKLSVPVFAVLIFSGAFDGMIPDDEDYGPPGIKAYTRMFEELKKIKKSKAKLPPKKAGEFIGLDEVNSSHSLAIWRNQRCPIVKNVEFEPEIENNLKNFGYERVQKSGSIFTFIRGKSKDGKPGVLATPEWSKVFSDPRRLELFDKSQGRLLMVYGIVSSVTIRHYGEDKEKEMMAIKIFTGKETTDDIVAWPKKDAAGNSLGVSEVFKEVLQPGRTVAVLVRPSIYRDKPSASVVSVMQFTL